MSSCFDDKRVLDKVYLISLRLLTHLHSPLIWKLRIYSPPDVMKAAWTVDLKGYQAMSRLVAISQLLANNKQYQ